MTYGFIGTGNMGGALARALVKTVSPTDIFLNNRTMARAEALAAELGAHCADAETIASSCGCIFLGVKPHLLPGVLAQLRPTLTAREDKPLLVSMAAGVTIAAIEQAVPGSAVVRIMPNTACAVGAGLTLYDTNSAVTQQQLDALLRDMAASGRLEALPEELIDAGSAVAGGRSRPFCQIPRPLVVHTARYSLGGGTAPMARALGGAIPMAAAAFGGFRNKSSRLS